MTDRKTLDQARKWANDGPIDRRTIAAAEVIRSLPDEIVDGERVRDAIDSWEFCNISAGEFVDMLRDLLPTPPAPPTLADMEVDELMGCEWLPAEVAGHPDECVITRIFMGGRVRLLNRATGSTFETDHDNVLPITSAPKMQWPQRLAYSKVESIGHMVEEEA